MKKFLPLLLLLLAPVWAAPLAEAADVEVALSGGPLNTAIHDAIQAKVTSGEVAFDSIKVTLTGSSSITSTIVIPYSGTFASSDSSAPPISVTINKLAVDGGTLTSPAAGRHFKINSNGTATFSNTTLKGGTNSGGIDVAGGTATFTGTTFDGNKATGDGGAVKVDGGKAEFTGGTKFQNNSATANGGGLYAANGADVKFDAVTFTGNSAKNGGAIYVNSGVLTLPEGVVLRGNDATDSGGAVYAASGVDVKFGAATFEGNHSKKKGGAVYVSESITVNENVTFQKNGVDGTDGMGGAIYSVKDVTLQKAAFKENSAGGSGGAVYAEGVVKGTGSTFQANQATLDGGAIYATGAAVLEDCSFLNNSTRGPGGAIRTDNAGTDVQSCTFKENTSGTNGGAVFLYGGAGASSFKKVCFVKNTASDSGGAISCAGTGAGNTIGVSDSVFLNNTAGGSQGGALNLAGIQATVVRSTFEANECATGSGGAIFSAAALSRIANCTFYENQAGSSGDGGAINLGGTTDNERTAIFYDTFVNNKAGGNGGGLYTKVAVRMMGNVLVGNNAPATRGADVFSDGSRKITSLGYNVMRVFGTQGGSGPIDVSGLWTDYVGPTSESVTEDSIDAKNTPAAFFGADPKPTESDVTAGSAASPYRLQVLIPSNPPNSLLDRIPNRYASSRFVIYFSGIPKTDGGKAHTDERGQDRDASSVGDNDIGAYERGTGGSANDPDTPGGLGGLATIRISGVPNSLTSIGQTASLVAEAYDQGGKRIAAPVSVTWSSSNTGVAHIDDNGNLVALSLGTTVIRATTKSNSMNGSPATDSVTLTVDKDVSDYLNIHPRIWQQLGIYNEAAASSGSTLAFADVNPALVQAGAFQTAFRGAWSASASQITKLGASAPISVKSASGFSIDGYTAEKPGASLILGGRKKGEVLALLYRWSFNWETLSKLLGRKVTEAPSVSELFKALRVDFVPAAGATGWNVIGAGGVSAQDAAAKGALKLVRGNNGVTVALTAYLANAGGAAPDGARLMNGLLVVPDGAADASVGGTMWISQRVASSGGGSKGSGEGGGGCSLGLVEALGLALAGGLLLRRR